jgi:hypothetical protein
LPGPGSLWQAKHAEIAKYAEIADPQFITATAVRHPREEDYHGCHAGTGIPAQQHPHWRCAYEEVFSTLEEVFYLSQSIVSVAVAGPLIYLGVQVRAADRGQRSIMQQGRADRASKAALTVAAPELADVWQRGMDADPSMTRIEVMQWLLMCRSAFLSGEDSFLQHQAGTLDRTAFDSYCARVRSYLGNLTWVMWDFELPGSCSAVSSAGIFASSSMHRLPRLPLRDASTCTMNGRKQLRR